MIGRSHQYDGASHGRFLINVDAEFSATPVTLLLNWKPEPDSLTPRRRDATAARVGNQLPQGARAGGDGRNPGGAGVC